MLSFQIFKEFVMHPHRLGPVVVSSKELAETLAKEARVREASFVQEFGAGTGAITSVVVEALWENVRYVAIEIDPRFGKLLRNRCSSTEIGEDTAVKAREHLEAAGAAGATVLSADYLWRASGPVAKAR